MLRTGPADVTLAPMLREDKSVRAIRPGWLDRLSGPGGVRITFSRRGKAYRFLAVDTATYDRIAITQKSVPVLIGQDQPRGWLWWYLNRFYWATDALSAGDVQALVLQRETRKRAQLEKARAALSGGTQAAEPRIGRRESISEAVRHEVWRRDGGACVDCGSRERLEFDHIIPFSKGGSNTARNLELRCEVCNRAKSDRI